MPTKETKSAEERIREYWRKESEKRMKPVIEKWNKKRKEEKKEPRN